MIPRQRPAPPRGGYISGDRTRSDAELQWVRNRPSESRPPYPRVGDAVLYRSNEWHDPVPAEVIAVDVQEDDQHMLWPDPWPLCRLRVPVVIPDSKRDVSGLLLPGAATGRPSLVETREARLEGSAGWLPADHDQYPHRYPKPIPGGQ